MPHLKTDLPTWAITMSGVDQHLSSLGGVEYFERKLRMTQLGWAHKCHEISLKLIRTGALGPKARVARGSCRGVGGQHSWIALSGDCYSSFAPILDPTLWSYVDAVPALLVTTLRGPYGHRPHGAGGIMEWGQPMNGSGRAIDLTPSFELTDSALFWLNEMLGPLDFTGWANLTAAPVEDWPAGEIFAAMDDTAALRALVPIDKLGMLTDRNPSELYR